MTRKLVFFNLILASVLVFLGYVAAVSESAASTGTAKRSLDRALYSSYPHPLVWYGFETDMYLAVDEGQAPVAYGVPQTGGSGAYWGRSLARAASGFFSAWAAGGGANSSAGYGGLVPPGTNTSMTTGAVDLTPFVEASLKYDVFLSTGIQSLFSVGASVNGQHFYGYSYYGTTSGFEGNTINLKSWPYLGDLTQYDRVWFRFSYSTQIDEEWPGPFVDNIRLEVLEPGEVFHDTFLYGDSVRWTDQKP